ncbi:uncharacterized protein N7496_006261 [Penicillium cataractarum]|uniref:Uncharacterized protein n=1 Tax=Penicillium cataractarum TaxID=2100454 RepID=A0A9W9S347_9EURO|nr:uncharacterized protein N7496_006261 [Penicillium cataractarum]KAJ5370169.1 hypothetical protein N7496_006261 [Penicillium cataractarum]
MSTAFLWKEVRYSYHPSDWFLAYGSVRIDSEQVINILVAEYAIRELRQREEALNNRIVALQKAKAIDLECSELDKANEKLEETRAKVPGKEYALYRAVSLLSSYFKDEYDRLRRDTKWFMREEMVQDCVDRGGCCSRGCGCCSQRPLHNGGKGDGHCTTECWCCTVYRGYEVPEDDKEEIRADLKKKT